MSPEIYLAEKLRYTRGDRDGVAHWCLGGGNRKLEGLVCVSGERKHELWSVQ